MIDKDRVINWAENARHNAHPSEFPDIEISMTPSDLLRFAALVAAHERERIDELHEQWRKQGESIVDKIAHSLSLGPAFSLGAWWSDRPWRDEPPTRVTPSR